MIYGLAIVQEKSLVGKVTFESYLFYGWGVQALGSVCIALGVYLFDSNRQAKVKLLVAKGSALGVVRALAGFAFIQAQIAGGAIGVLVTVTNFKIVLITIFGALILHERQRLKEKFAISIIAIVAMFLILS